jgi:pilus assembly protein CpaF
LEKNWRLVTEISEVVGVDPNTGETIVEPIFTFRGTADDRRMGDEQEPAEEPLPGTHYFTGYLPSFTRELLSSSDGASRLDLFM